MSFDIFWDDLTEECQNRLFEFLGGENGNMDVFPIVRLVKDTDENGEEIILRNGDQLC